MKKNLLILCMLFLGWQASAQTMVTGTVYSGDDQAPLPGASVSVKGTTTGTITNVDGQYSILINDENATLRFSFIGYETQTIEVGNNTVIDITLVPDLSQLEEVVVVGYGIQKKSDVTGSLVSADLEAFEEAPNTSVLQALSGTLPGVAINQVAAAGEEPNIQIRGRTSINGSLNPLVIVDGIIYRGRLGDINPADIESTNVLKDVSSKAIYGAQAANGVILITTKKGKTASKPRINYKGTYSIQSPNQELKPLDREGYIRAARDVDYENGYVGPDFTQENPDWTFDGNSSVSAPEILEGFDNGTDTDWYGTVTDPGFISDHQLSISGRTEGGTGYYVSAGYTDQEGWMLNDQYERISARINIDTKVTDWLTVGANTFGAFTDFSGESPTLNNLITFSPLSRPRDDNGEFIINPNGNLQLNPFLISESDDLDNRNNISAIAYANIEVPQVEGLSYRINFGNNYRWNVRANANEFGAGLVGSAFKTNNSTYDMMLDNIITYKRTLAEDHDMDVTFVAGINRISYQGTTARGENFPTLALSYNSLDQAINPFITSEAWEESFSYQMGRVNYGYKGKYLLTATLRRDGFSGFAENEKTALFPSIGVGWVISDEAFLNNSEELSYLKLRASYGENGNLTSRYSSLARVEAGEGSRYVFGDGGSTVNGQSIASLANADLAWETTRGINIGLDFGLIGNRVTGSLDFYQTTTEDLLWDFILPEITGFSQIRTNLGEIQNVGFEALVSAKVIDNATFKWTADLNFDTNRNEIVSLIGLDNDDDGQEDDLISNGLFIGESIGTVFGYEIDGLYQVGDTDIPDGYLPGMHRVQDVNGDESLTPDDRVILGRTEPAYSFGIRNTLSYNNLTLRIFIKSTQGGSDGFLGENDAIGNANANTPGNAQTTNWFADIDYWSPRNPNATFRGPGNEQPLPSVQFFQRNFIRLQDISLAYSFDPATLEKLGLAGLKVFVSGKNLLTITDWEGWDPETGVGLTPNGLPIMRSFAMGIDVSF